VGLLVSVFSKTLVLLAGIGMVIIQVRPLSFTLVCWSYWYFNILHLSYPNRYSKICAPLPRLTSPTQNPNWSLTTPQVAARNGIDLVRYLKLKERASTSRILAMLNQHTAFKLAFAISFALSAFMSF
jgi:hypothetical protein